MKTVKSAQHRIEEDIQSIDSSSLGCMTYGGAIQELLEGYAIYDLLAFCCHKLKLRNLIWDYLAGLIISHYVSLKRYEEEGKRYGTSK